MPAVAHLYAHDGPPNATTGVSQTAAPGGATSTTVVGGDMARPLSISSIMEAAESQDGDESVGEGKAAVVETVVAASTSRDMEPVGVYTCVGVGVGVGCGVSCIWGGGIWWAQGEIICPLRN